MLEPKIFRPEDFFVHIDNKAFVVWTKQQLHFWPLFSEPRNFFIAKFFAIAKRFLAKRFFPKKANVLKNCQIWSASFLPIKPSDDFFSIFVQEGPLKNFRNFSLFLRFAFFLYLVWNYLWAFVFLQRRHTRLLTLRSKSICLYAEKEEERHTHKRRHPCHDKQISRVRTIAQGRLVGAGSSPPRLWV